MRPPTQSASRYRVQRWIVRRGPLVAAVAVTAGVAAKTLLLIFTVLGLSLTPSGSLAAQETMDQVPWPLAIFMLLVSWMVVFLGVPLWQMYLAHEHRWRQWGEDTTEDDRPAAHAKGARTKRPR